MLKYFTRYNLIGFFNKQLILKSGVAFFLVILIFSFYPAISVKAFDIKAAIVANDRGFTLNSQDIDKQWALPRIGVPDAWAKTTGNTNTVVAIIDTGVDATHEDLQNMSLVPGYDFINGKPIIGRVNSDDNGHGTLIAGVLAASTNNGFGISGMNWAVSVMPLKALDSQGKGNSATIAEAITWATDHGASIINLSLGGSGFMRETTLASAISYAFHKNVVLVAAAGNDISITGANLDVQPVFPICDDQDQNMIIGVAATDQNDIKADFSNYGKNCVDVSAPGKRILSTINFDPATKSSAPNSYAYASGTSLAVPFVSGEAALIHSLYPTLTNIDIRNRIIASADPIDNLNLNQCGGGSCRGLIGSGRINVLKSLDPALAALAPNEGDLVRVEGSSVIYQILGGQKRLVSEFVFNQRFNASAIKSINASQLATIPEGPAASPKDGTLVKNDTDATVYYISGGKRLAVSYAVFAQRNFNFQDVVTTSLSDINAWDLNGFLPPPDGTLVKSLTSKTVYWVVNQEIHPINNTFYISRGLSIFPILIVPDSEITSYPIGESYIQ